MRHVRIGRVVLFLFLTFTLSWGFDLLIVAARGRGAYLDFGMTPWGMFVPAFVALVLQLFIFKDSPIYFRKYKEKPRWILLGFLFLTLAYGAITVLVVTASGAGRVYQGVGTVLITLWTMLVLFVSGQSEVDAFKRAGLQLGDVKQGQRFVLSVVTFFIFQAMLNLGAGLGDFQGRVDQIYGVPIPGGLYPVALVVLFVAVTVIGGPLTGLAAVFGEEYGWRGFLQGELVKLGKARGVLLVGLVWGVWHFPIILRGVHTYPATGLGLVLGVVFFVLWGFVQSYAVLKTGSIWVAAFMHGVVNSVYGFLLTYVVRPNDKVLSFGLGVYGLVCIGLVVVMILRDPVWRNGS
jgi:membrane protease YdiL (CAAX protease family)